MGVNMKTILVIYTNKKLDTKQVEEFVKDNKVYAFVTNSKVKVGDHFESTAYTTAMQCVEVLNKSYKFFHKKTGMLGNKKLSILWGDVKEIEIKPKIKQVVVAHKTDGSKSNSNPRLFVDFETDHYFR